MIRIIDETSPCAMTEIDIYKQLKQGVSGDVRR